MGHLATKACQRCPNFFFDNATTPKMSFRFGAQSTDAYWTLLKDGIPNSINSTVGGKPNKVLWKYMRSQQWRWECHDKDILAETGQTLATF